MLILYMPQAKEILCRSLPGLYVAPPLVVVHIVDKIDFDISTDLKSSFSRTYGLSWINQVEWKLKDTKSSTKKD